jgi:hypothetical protein
MAPHEFFDKQLLPFPTRIRKPILDEQLSRFVDMIQWININVLLLDVMQVRSYARYLKDIISNKRSLAITEVIKLTEECSVAILQQLPEKKKDSGCPMISCSIGTQNFDQASYDLGASEKADPLQV